MGDKVDKGNKMSPQDDAHDDSPDIDEKDQDKVFLGTEDLTGKAIIKSRAQLDGPFTTPRYMHSIPLPFFKPKHPPPPPPDSLDDAKPMPDATANILSLITFSWVTRIMALGVARTLEPPDLYKLKPEREAESLSDRLNKAFQKRWDKAEAFNDALEKSLSNPTDKSAPRPPWTLRVKWRLGKGEEKGKTFKEKELDWRTRTGRKHPSLAWSLSDVFGWYFWSAGFFKVRSHQVGAVLWVVIS